MQKSLANPTGRLCGLEPEMQQIPRKATAPKRESFPLVKTRTALEEALAKARIAANIPVLKFKA